MDTELQRYGGGSGMDFFRWMLGGGVRGYRRLNPPVRRRVRLARLGNRKLMRSPTKMKRPPRLRLRLLRWFFPLNLLAKLRDAYVRLLQAASNKLVLYEGLSLGAAPPPCPPLSSPNTGDLDLKAKDQELNRLLKLYFSRTRTPIVLSCDDYGDS